jgi:hypothetical protein
MSNLYLAGRVFDLLPLHWNAVALIHARTHHRSEYGRPWLVLGPDLFLQDDSVRFCHETNNHYQAQLSYGRS